MKDLIKALTILQKYMDENNQFPTSCEHDVLYVHGVNFEHMDINTAKEILDCGFIPGSECDTIHDWGNMTEEFWKKLKEDLSPCCFSYKYGSC